MATPISVDNSKNMESFNVIVEESIKETLRMESNMELNIRHRKGKKHMEYGIM